MRRYLQKGIIERAEGYMIQHQVEINRELLETPTFRRWVG